MNRFFTNAFFMALSIFATIVVLSCCLLNGEARSAQLQFENPCPQERVVLEQKADAPLRISIQKATCEDFYSRIDLQLENISHKTIIKYEIMHIQDFEIRKGSQSSLINGSLIEPGQALTVNVNGGVRKSFGEKVGLLKRDTIKLSWIKFSDGTLWGEDFGRSKDTEREGYDLVLRDDKEPFSASFKFENNTFHIGSDMEYGFGGGRFKVETIGCNRKLTFDFLWKDYDYSYHPRKSRAETIIIKAGDTLRGEFIYDSCTKTARGTIRNENQNLTLMSLNGTNINLRKEVK